MEEVKFYSDDFNKMREALRYKVEEIMMKHSPGDWIQFSCKKCGHKGIFEVGRINSIDSLVNFVIDEMNAYLRKFNMTSSMVELGLSWKKVRENLDKTPAEDAK